jgi:hypothetical protein
VFPGQLPQINEIGFEWSNVESSPGAPFDAQRKAACRGTSGPSLGSYGPMRAAIARLRGQGGHAIDTASKLIAISGSIARR